MRRGDLKGGMVIFSIIIFSRECVWLDELGWGGGKISKTVVQWVLGCIASASWEYSVAVVFFFLFLPHVCTP